MISRAIAQSYNIVKRRERGTAAMLAILALTALLFVVLAVLWLSNGALYLSMRQKRIVALRALAEAGLQYAYWQIVFNSAVPPQTYGPTALGSGTFTVTVTDNSAQIAGTYKLVSTATISGETLTYTRVIDGASSVQVQGTVFEDLNYGGGAGRSYAVSAGAPVNGATVEVYSAAGGYLSSTTTSAGAYTITGLLANTTYTVRVVNSTVQSTRSGSTSSLVGVQTYRTNGSSGSAVAVTDHVGGEDPSKTDAAANSTNATLSSLTASGATPQSITTVTPASTMTGVDFGYNFDTVVNKNDTGQGSLRQAITNANALSNTGLAQSGKTAGVENLLFMLPTGSAYSGSNASYATAFSGGIASITLASALPQISDTLTLDATTQSGWSSAPVIELNGAGAGVSAYGLDVTAANSTIKGFVINRCALAAIRLSGSATGGTIQGCYLGTNSAGTAALANQNGLLLQTSGNTVGGTSASQLCLL
ncbi:MAG TPA: carboxypeptidase-like regulatory domain-containing protein, partial [Chthonomonadaceae bacterium]|nr:carboxypeptidase-like regulatory domain-containing protein [Chthonomonadaceae bacterium]